jgi:hypothetical protein
MGRGGDLVVEFFDVIFWPEGGLLALFASLVGRDPLCECRVGLQQR